MATYAELQVTTNFSFLRGASHPEELVVTAAALGLSAIGITDRNTLAGVVRAHVVAKQVGIRLVVGARLDLEAGNSPHPNPLPTGEGDLAATHPLPSRERGSGAGPSLLCFPTDRAAYGRLSRLLSVGRQRAAKGECRIWLADLLAHGAGQIIVALPPEQLDKEFSTALLSLINNFKDRELSCGKQTLSW